MATTTCLSGLQALLEGFELGPIPTFTAANVLNHPIDIYHSYLAANFQNLVECDPDLVYESILPANTTGNGDLDIVLPKLKLPGAPKELAESLLNQIRPLSLFLLPFNDGIHIRFFFNPKLLPRILLPYINDRKATYGVDAYPSHRNEQENERKKVLVEFSSPNIAREFTAAHLRSTILGAFVANIHEAMGWDVIRVNYLGDWGQHLGLLSLGWQKYGSEHGPDGVEEHLFRYMHDLYMRMEEELEPEQEARRKALEDGQEAIDLESHGLFAARAASFKRMEEGEPEAIALWKKLRDITVEYYVEAYARLNVKFDSYSGESQVSLNPDGVEEIKAIFKSKGIYEEQGGAWVIDYNKHGTRLGIANLQGRNGSTTYLLRDIATVFDRFKTYSFDKMLYVVGEQDLHFRQLFKTIELMGYTDIAKRLKHITFSRASGPSSHGAVQLLGDVLDQCESNMREAINADLDQYQVDGYGANAKVMGINSLVIQELASKKALSNVLGFSLMTELDGETGPVLQICYTRLCLAIASIGACPTLEEIPHIDYSSLWEAPWCDLLRLMARYPDVVSSAFKSLDPAAIISYLFRIVEELTCCLDEIDEDHSEGESSSSGLKYAARSFLFENVRQVLKNGMSLLGLLPSE